MIKKLSIIVLISSSLYSQSFSEFLNNALQNSPYLKSSNLSILQAKEEGSALMRYENPSLDLEYFKFNPDNEVSDNGYSISFTQPIRLWGVSSDKNNLASSLTKKALSNHSLTHAQFIHEISLAYTLYSEQKRLSKLRVLELEIAKHIYTISKERNKAGTISKGIMLQSEVEYEMIKINTQSLKLNSLDTYFELLKLAGIKDEIELDFKHNFNIETSLKQINPKIAYIKSLQEEAIASSKINSHKVESIDIVAGYEKEPEESIYKVGVSIPLVLFNKKSQEVRISELEADKAELLIKSENTKIKIQLSKLQKQREILLGLASQNKQLLKTQTKLFEMFKDAYKIANTNLLELQNMKNKLIKTKENLIKIKTALNQNAINTNYITGVYND